MWKFWSKQPDPSQQWEPEQHPMDKTPTIHMSAEMLDAIVARVAERDGRSSRSVEQPTRRQRTALKGKKAHAVSTMVTAETLAKLDAIVVRDGWDNKSAFVRHLIESAV